MDEHLAALAPVVGRGVVVHLDGELDVELVGLDRGALGVGVVALPGGLLVVEAHAGALQRRRERGDDLPVELVLVATWCLRAGVEGPVRLHAVSYSQIRIWHRSPPVGR
jgi:hypothetical protein